MEVTDNLLKTYFTERIFKKNEFLTKEKHFEKNIFFVKSGIVRFVTNINEDKEFTFDFGLPNDFVNSYRAYKENRKSEFSIQAISFVRVFYIDKESVEDILRRKPELSFFMITVLEQLLIKKTEREILLIKYTPQEIYQYLINREPYLIQNIPLKYIASYIGITPQALSRIRNRIY